MRDVPQLNPWKLFVGSMVPNWLLERAELSAGAKLTYARLCQYAGRHGVAFPTQLELAAALGVSERHARRYLKELAEHDLITVHRTGLRKANRITFNLHPWMAGNPRGKMWKNPPDRTNTSGQKRTDTSGPIGKDSVEVDSRNPARRGRAPGRKTGGKAGSLLQPGERAGDVATLSSAVAGALAMNGTTPDEKSARALREAETAADMQAVRHRLEMMNKTERAELDKFLGWLEKDGATEDERRAILSELLSRDDITKPYAYYAPKSAARERIRRLFA